MAKILFLVVGLVFFSGGVSWAEDFPTDCMIKGGKYSGPFEEMNAGRVTSWPAFCEFSGSGSIEMLSRGQFYQRFGYSQETTSIDPSDSSDSSTDPCMEIEQKVAECESSAAEAVESSCNPKQNREIKSAASQLSNSGMAGACDATGIAAGAVQAAILAFKGACSYSQKGCNEACSQAATMVKSASVTCSNYDFSNRIAASKKSCINTNKIMSGAEQDLQSVVGTAMAMQQCSNMTGNGNIPLVQGPSDCSDLNNTSPVCQCERHPEDCRNGNQASTGTSSGGSGSRASAGTGVNGLTGAPLTLGDGFGSELPEELAKIRESQNGSRGALGRGGAGRNISGGDSQQKGAGRRPGAGGGQPELNTNVNSGYRSGGGPGVFKGGGSRSGGGAQGSERSYVGNGRPAQKSNVDLKQFMPGGIRDPRRGLASGVGPDGLTGQGTDIWKKVNYRYISVSERMKH